MPPPAARPLLAIACLTLGCIAPGAALEVAEPPSSELVEARQPERERWSWNRQHAAVSEDGKLSWSPEPFAFEAGDSVKYIDYAGGDDADDGSRARPWKHHPWDPQATGAAQACEGIHTYVFKRGVTYRGRLVADESGSPGDPIRLTSDPGWGEGAATIVGSERVTGWQTGADHPKIPEAAKVWYADLDYLPRGVWASLDDGASYQRLHIARTPNWTISDPEDVLSEWWELEQPKWWEGKHKVKVGGKEMHLGIDRKHLTGPRDMYEGAIVRSEWGIVMGTPFPSKIERYFPERNAIAYQGRWWGTSGKLITGNRYLLEDKPHFLDEGGEFWFDRKGNGGRLYLRLPGDVDPNSAVVEAGARYNLIEDVASAASPKRLDVLQQSQRDALNVSGVSHLHVSGLRFMFTNTQWDIENPAWMHKEIDNAAVRLLGEGSHLSVTHCEFRHVNKAVRITPLQGRVQQTDLLVADNDIAEIDHGAISLGSGKGSDRVRVLRNRLHRIGLRPYRQSDGHALRVAFADTYEIAGNILERCWGAGIFVHGGKGGGSNEDVPLSRVLIHHNRVVDSLLAANDWGGIETWQGGPFYVYNNISGNANGYWHWSALKNQTGNARLGFAYYCDGAFKNYHFNNVAWGLTDDPDSKHMAKAAFYSATPTIENLLFNNTASKFWTASKWSPRGGRQLFLGNLFIDIVKQVFHHGKQKEDPQPVEDEFPFTTMGYARNVAFDIASHGDFGVFEKSGRGHATLDAMAAALAERGALASDIGTVAETSPVRDNDARDFRLTADSAAVDHGVRVFVPWSLARTVGEWHFRRIPSDPTTITDHSWYMTPDYTNRSNYHEIERFDLQAVDATVDDYVDAPYEDWIPSALVLDGESSHARLEHAVLAAPIEYDHKVGRRKSEKRTLEGAAKASPDVHGSSLLVECIVRTEPGHGGSVLLAKMDDQAGYRLAVNHAGGITFGLRAGGELHELPCGARINDGEWHHVVAEFDRGDGTATIYIDGRAHAEGPLAIGDASLANGGDLFVGKAAEGHHFHGAVDFLRICLATLEDAQTTIDELYDWQFDGPHLRDLRGVEIHGERRDAGAFELAE